MSEATNESTKLDIKKSDQPDKSDSSQKSKTSLEEKLCTYFAEKFPHKDDNDLPQMGKHPLFKLENFIFDSQPQEIKILSGFYETLSKDEKSDFCNWLLTQKNNFKLLDAILKIDQNTSHSILKGKIEENQGIALKLARYQKLSPKKRELIDSFSGLRMDAISLNSARINCAQIAARKKSRYPFNATVLGSGDISEFFSRLKSSPTRPLRELFVISGTHWNSGIIEIDKNNKAKLFLIDPLGFKFIPKRSRIPNERQQFLHVFPQGKFYCNDTVIQNSPIGCGIFSLDTMRHLAQIENYIGENLFDHLDKHTVDNIFSKELTLCKLPLALTRSMQTRELKNFITDSKEKEQSINKKNQKAMDCFSQDFRFIAEKDKEVNLRLVQVRSKYYNQILDFVENLEDSELETMISQHTLEGLSARINQSTDKLTDSKQQQKAKAEEKTIYTTDPDPQYPDSEEDSQSSDSEDDPLDNDLMDGVELGEGEQKLLTPKVDSPTAQVMRGLLNNSILKAPSTTTVDTSLEQEKPLLGSQEKLKDSPPSVTPETTVQPPGFFSTTAS